MPITSIFAREKKIALRIIEPKFVLAEDVFASLGDIFKKRIKKSGGRSRFYIDRIIVNKGELTYTAPKLSINLLDFDLEHSFITAETAMYRLRSPHLKIITRISRDDVKFEGSMIGEFKQQRDSWKINLFSWDTEFLKINVNGRIFKDKTMSLNTAVQGSLKQVFEPLIGRLSIREFLYGNARIKRDKAGKISIDGQFKANSFTIGGESFENLRGTAKWDNVEQRYRINTIFNDESFTSRMDIEAQKENTGISIQEADAAKVARIIKIDDTAPLGGIFKNGDISVKKSEISGTVKLAKAAVIDESQFQFDGAAQFTYFTKRKALRLRIDDAYAEFGKASMTVASDPDKKERLLVRVNADIDETAALDKYAKYYVGFRLSPWKLQHGKGKINLEVKKIGSHYYAESDFNIRDFLSSGQEIDALSGRIAGKEGITTGFFDIKDKLLSTRAGLYVDKNKTQITFPDVAGESRKILKILDYDLEISGGMNGNFTFEKLSGETHPLVRGNFTGKRIDFYGFIFDNVSGRLETRDYVSVKELDYLYKDGQGQADVVIDFNTKRYKIDGAISGIDINKMHGEFSGRGDISFSGAGSFANENLLANDPVNIAYKSDDIAFFKDHNFRLKGESRIYTDFSDFRIKPGVRPGEIIYKDVLSPFSFEFNRLKDRYSGNFNLELKDINLLIPWGNNQGEMNLQGEIFTSEDGEMRAEGHAVVKGSFLSFPGFPHTLDNFTGDLIFNDLNFTLRSLRGSLGGGEVESKGYLLVKDDKLKDIYLDFQGKDMLLYPMDRTGCRLTTRDLTLKYIEAEEKLLLAGDLEFSSSSWERELDEPISFSTGSPVSSAGSKFLDMLKYDLRLICRKDFQVKNSLLHGKGKFDLELTGTSEFPKISGTIECREGYLEMADNKFELIKARASFNKTNNDPALDLESETFIKNYRIRFNVSGTMSHLKPEFISNPPLPARDILTLLSLGELFERPTTQDLSYQVGVGTTGLLAQEITDQIKKRTKKIFGDYVLRIDPNITNITGASVEDSSRVIVGKSIAEDIMIVYSTNFSTRRQEVVYVQYRLSPTISLIGMRNEDGRFSIDIRFRKRH